MYYDDKIAWKEEEEEEVVVVEKNSVPNEWHDLFCVGSTIFFFIFFWNAHSIKKVSSFLTHDSITHSTQFIIQQQQPDEIFEVKIANQIDKSDWEQCIMCFLLCLSLFFYVTKDV